MADDEVEVGMATYVADNIFAQTTELQSCVVVVSGPNDDGEIVLLAGAETYLPRLTALKLMNELVRRLMP